MRAGRLMGTSCGKIRALQDIGFRVGIVKSGLRQQRIGWIYCLNSHNALKNIAILFYYLAALR
jgi:hypothetical protein